ncbi:hemin-degrading factor [Paenalcaligenes hominis]|uniref:hemin-degrading factor n=1 Tax=Paenalcaligenes hominis TaxID=643674 RepID=UPI0035236AAC
MYYHDQITATQLQYNMAVASKPGRIRDIAKQIGLTELELVAAQCGEIQARHLKASAQEILLRVGELGSVMALTRNNDCVHERHGRYENIKAGEKSGIVLGPDIDLRLFFSTWGTVWAVEDKGRKSLQFFDVYGHALHKVFCTEQTDQAAYDALVSAYAEPIGSYWPEIKTATPKEDQTLTQAPAGLREHWLGLKDTHAFHSMLMQFNVSRLTALRDVGHDLAQPVANSTAERMLEQAAASGLSIMCFVSNAGIVQIHTGPIQQLRRTGPWFNVLDPSFNLHLNTEAITQSWVVNKPTVDGCVTSLECYSAQGELIVQFFGARKPGQAELAEWRQLLESFCDSPLAA